MRAKLDSVKAELRSRINDTVSEVGTWLNKVITGHYQYYGVPGNYKAMRDFQRQVGVAWFCVLNRRSQRRGLTWEKMEKLLERWLPTPRILHPYPDKRFARQHPR